MWLYFFSLSKTRQQPKNPNHTIGFYTQSAPFHGLSLRKSPIKNHTTLFGSGPIVKPNQTKLGSTKPNSWWGLDFGRSMKGLKFVFKPYFHTQLSFHVSSTLAICSLCQDHNREQLNFPPILFDQVECNRLIKVFKI